MRNELTGKAVAKIAAQVMNGKINTHNIKAAQLRALAASCLTQVKDKKRCKDAFINWVRNKGNSSIDEHQMQEMMRKNVPEEIARQIEQLEKKFSPVRRLRILT